MKRNALKLISVLSVAALLVVGLQSHVAFDEGTGGDDDDRKKDPLGGSCTYYCWYKDNQGKWYSVDTPGTYTDCPRGSGDCTPVGCSPIVACSTH